MKVLFIVLLMNIAALTSAAEQKSLTIVGAANGDESSWGGKEAFLVAQLPTGDLKPLRATCFYRFDLSGFRYLRLTNPESIDPGLSKYAYSISYANTADCVKAIKGLTRSSMQKPIRLNIQNDAITGIEQ